MTLQELLISLQNHITGTEYSLNDGKLPQAEGYLNKAALALKALERYPNIPNCEELFGKFKQVSMRYFFAYTYGLIDESNKAIKQNNLKSAKLLHSKTQEELDWLTKEYASAVEANQSQWIAFIDFPQDLKYLTIYFEQSLQKYRLAEACQNLSRAFNFQETQINFGMTSNRVFSPPSPPTTPTIEEDPQEEFIIKY